MCLGVCAETFNAHPSRKLSLLVSPFFYIKRRSRHFCKFHCALWNALLIDHKFKPEDAVSVSFFASDVCPRMERRRQQKDFRRKQKTHKHTGVTTVLSQRTRKVHTLRLVPQRERVFVKVTSFAGKTRTVSNAMSSSCAPLTRKARCAAVFEYGRLTPHVEEVHSFYLPFYSIAPVPYWSARMKLVEGSTAGTLACHRRKTKAWCGLSETQL